MEALRVTDHRFLGGPGRWRDSGMMGTPPNERPDVFWQADLDEAVRELVAVVRETRPQVVVTYDSKGGYGHPDHVQAHRVTMAAFDAAADPGYAPGLGEPWAASKLYCTAFPKSVLQQGIDRLKEAEQVNFFGADSADDLPFGNPDDEVTTEVDATAHVDAKMAAMRAHKTQISVDGPFFALADGVGLQAMGREYFVLARGDRGPGDGPQGREDDLFAGIRRSPLDLARTGGVGPARWSRSVTAGRLGAGRRSCRSDRGDARARDRCAPPETAVPQTAVPQPTALDDLTAAGRGLVALRDADVGRTREARRTGRFVRLAVVVWALVGLAWLRALTVDGGPFLPLPSVDPFLLTIIVFFGLLLAMAVGQQVLSGRSPHVVYRPEQIDVSLDDVVGIDGVKDDVVRSLNLFLAHRTFSQEMGGTPRRGLLFEGAPGTGKTHLARAMAKEAGVPFLFVSGTSFQSMWYGATAKKIRSYFKALRKAARKEGGAIGFMEEIDAIAMSRGGVSTAMITDDGQRVHGAGDGQRRDRA